MGTSAGGAVKPVPEKKGIAIIVATNIAIDDEKAMD